MDDFWLRLVELGSTCVVVCFSVWVLYKAASKAGVYLSERFAVPARDKGFAFPDRLENSQIQQVAQSKAQTHQLQAQTEFLRELSHTQSEQGHLLQKMSSHILDGRICKADQD